MPTNFSAYCEAPTQKVTTILQNKHERQLYVGNLPPGLSSTQVADLLNCALLKMGANIQVCLNPVRVHSPEILFSTLG